MTSSIVLIIGRMYNKHHMGWIEVGELLDKV